MFGFFGKPKNSKGASKRPRANTRASRRVRVTRAPIDMKPETPKLREKAKQQRRQRGMRTAAMMVMGMSLVALGNTAVQETLFKNPRFALRQIYVDTTGMLTPTQITRATGLVEGVNLLTVNLRDVREQVQRLPAVRSATVQRDFDGKLTITVEQRKPIAWVKCENLHWLPKRVSQGMMVDADGIAIPADTILPEYLSLPVIADESITQITPGCVIEAPRFKAALKLAKLLLERQTAGGYALTEVATPNKFALVASFDKAPTVTFSQDDMEAQMKRYDAFTNEAHVQNWTADQVNLVAKNVAPVKMAEAVIPVPDPEAPAPSAKAKESPPKAKAAPSSRGKAKAGSAKTTGTKTASVSRRATRQAL